MVLLIQIPQPGMSPQTSYGRLDAVADAVAVELAEAVAVGVAVAVSVDVAEAVPVYALVAVWLNVRVAD
jgi:hypothetical protein